MALHMLSGLSHEVLHICVRPELLDDLQVIFPALDLRVKNVANAYSLEHQTESHLFDQMFLLLTAALKEKGSAPMELRRELICCTEAIQTTLCQHLSKEEEQVLPHDSCDFSCRGSSNRELSILLVFRSRTFMNEYQIHTICRRSFARAFG